MTRRSPSCATTSVEPLLGVSARLSLYFPVTVGIRRYRVRWTLHPVEGGYVAKNKEFGSLRAGAEHVRDLGADCEFLDIRAVEIEPLTDQEKAAFGLFTDGRVTLI